MRSSVLLLLACAPAASAALLPRLRPPPRRLEAVVLDADGSFLDPDHKVSPANADAILAARAAGLKVFLATGRARSGPWVEECLAPHSLEAPGVFTQGLTSFDEGNRRVHEDKLDASVVEAVQRACKAVSDAGGEGVTLAAYVQERLVVACGDECDPFLMRYADYGDGEIELADYGESIDKGVVYSPPLSRETSSPSSSPSPSAAAEAEGGSTAAEPMGEVGEVCTVEQICTVEEFDLIRVLGGDVGNANKLLVLSSEEGVEALRDALEAALRGKPARVVKALSWTLEILPESTSKAAGLRRLLDALGIRPGHVMAVGDGENDLEMMRMVGLPVAMGNAVEALKCPRNVAFVTDSNAEDGVAKAILAHALPRSPANKPRRRDKLRRLLRRGAA